MSATTPDTPEGPELIEKFGTFLRRYCSDAIGVLAQHYPQETRSLEVDWTELHQFDPGMGDDYLAHPGEMREYAEEALRQYDLAIDISLSRAHVRVGNLLDPVTFYPGEFSPTKHNGQYRAIRGEVSKATDVKPKLQEAAFECQRCGTLSYILQVGGNRQEPHECSGCERQGPFRVNFDQSAFVDSQKLRVQTPPEIAEGAGQHIDVYVEDDLAGVAQTGDRVTIAGTLHLEDESSSQQKSRVFAQYLEGEHIAFDDSDPTDENITADERAEIEAIADGKLGDPLQVAGESLAPGIYGYQTEKQSLFLAAVGGARNSFAGDDKRGDFHVLLIGDPGTSKSKLTKRLATVAPRSVSVDSSEAGKAGLTAACVQDDFADGNTWTLEAGAAVMANDGVLRVDELDDMKPEKRESLGTPMSEQQINVSKAGINATLSTRCAVVAAANPKHGRFDRYEPIGQQIDLEPPLVSRFDLIFVLTDVPDEEDDSKIADRILNARDAAKRKHRGMEVDDEVAEEVEPPVAEDFLQKWIVLARQQPDPVFADPSVHAQLRDAFVELRGAYGYSEDDPVPITHRKLPGVTRLAEAIAKLEFSDVITERHARKALELVGRSMRDFGRDEEGKFDADVVEVGRSKTQHDRMKLVREAITRLDKEYDSRGCPREAVVEDETLADRFDAAPLHQTMDIMLEEGLAIEPQTDWIRFVGRA